PHDELNSLVDEIKEARIGAPWFVDRVNIADHPPRNPDDRRPRLAEHAIRQAYVAVAGVVDPTVSHANMVTPQNAPNATDRDLCSCKLTGFRAEPVGGVTPAGFEGFDVAVAPQLNP